MNKIGLGVVTYSRPEYLRQCLKSIRDNHNGGADYVHVFADFKDKETQEALYEVAGEFKGEFQFSWANTNLGVGISKNTLIKTLLAEKCEHIFIMEDDILMRNPNVCHHYIAEARRTGVQHLNFALHGPLNKGRQQEITYKGKMVTVYPQCVGAFSYYSRQALEVVGLMDENFFNAFEHVEHTYRMSLAGRTTPFWQFIDHPLSDKLLEEIPGSIDNSSIRPRDDWMPNIKKAQEYWIKKHGSWLPPR